MFLPGMVVITLKGIVRDKVLHGILVVAFLFLVIPAVSSLSMRQVTELSITLSLSLLSLLLLVLAVFLGGTSVWRDLDRKYVFNVLGLPLSRNRYLLGKFAGIALFLFFTAVLLGLVSCLVVAFAAAAYPPDRPVVWGNMLLAIAFSALGRTLLVAIAFLFSALSTSSFLPLFGTIALFFVGNASQNVYDFVHSPTAKTLPTFLIKTATALYYVLPNFSAFDLKVNAIYGVALNAGGLFLTFCYFVVYTLIVLSLSCLIFAKRELT